MTIGQRIGELAKKKNINLHQLSKMAGISYNTLYSIVKRESNKVDYETVCKVAAALGVSQIELSTGMSEQDLRRKLEIEFEEEFKEFEAGNLERNLAIFSIRHPLFIESLNSIGIFINLEGNEIYAEWKDVSIELTMDDLEALYDKIKWSFLDSIQQLLSIPIADEYQRTQDETATKPIDTPLNSKKPPEGE